jgi:cell division protein FtsW (lipid II flippase)
MAFLSSGRAFEKSLLLALLVACLLGHETSRRVVKLEEVMPLAALLLFALGRAKSRDAPMRCTWTERWVFLFLAAATVGAAQGLAAGHPSPNVLDEYLLCFQFALAILVARSGLTDAWAKRLVAAVVGCTALVALSYMRIFVSSRGLERAVSDQQVLFVLAIPLVFAFLLLDKNPKRRPVWLASMLVMAPAVYVTQTRALWLYIPLSLVLLAVLLRAHRHIAGRSLRTLAVAALAVVLTIFSYTTFTAGARAGHRAIASRAETLRDLSSDLSLAARVDLAFQAASRVARNPILGSGLGDHLRYRIVPDVGNIFFMDFSYMWLLWKLGILGLVPLLGLYTILVRRAWFVYRHTDNRFRRATAAGVFVAFIVFLILGIESGVLTIYRFNLVWAFLMGLFENWAQPLHPDMRVRDAS